MNRRIEENVERLAPTSIFVNGAEVRAYEGESLLTALMSSGELVLSIDPSSEMGRGPFCNMGVCFDCMVTVLEPQESRAADGRRVRACLTKVRHGLQVSVPGQHGTGQGE